MEKEPNFQEFIKCMKLHLKAGVTTDLAIRTCVDEFYYEIMRRELEMQYRGGSGLPKQEE